MTADVTYAGNIGAKVTNPHFLLTNTRGDYVALGNPNTSNYDGYFVRLDTYYKILANISPNKETTVMHIRDDVERATADMSQEFSLHDTGLVVKMEGEGTLALDCKRIYDESDKGRIYKVHYQRPHPGASENSLAKVAVITVTYTKYSDDSLAKKEYDLFVAIATTMDVTPIDRWREAAYPYDRRRGTSNTPWIYEVAMLSGKGTIALCAGMGLSEVQRGALDLLINKKKKLHSTPTLPALPSIAWQSLTQLETPRGIMAGLPWFFQEWSRDELISCGGLLTAREYAKVMRILDKWYDVVHDGMLPAMYPHAGLPSSDAPGWLGKRTRDLLVRLSEDNILHHIPPETLVKWRDRSGEIFDKARIVNGLVWSAANTTWMDTSSNDDGRTGNRIEIQALYLALYDAHTHLCTLTKTPVDSMRAQRAHDLLQNVRQKLVLHGRLLDGLRDDGTPDETVRPNIFIAWYAAPQLFSQTEWAQFFRHALPELWLPWGGLSSISQRSSNFHPRYTGEDVASYHRGDSWYFVNNMAAMALYTVNVKEFKPQVQELISASMRDMLTQGYCGHCSEVSSAERQEAAGCHSQAWSASTLLEALQTIDMHRILLS